MDYFELLRYRKSTRKFKQEQISQEDLAAILVAANNAPVGSNLYKDIHLTVVQNRDVLDKLSEAAIKRWEDKAKMKEIVGNTPNVELGRKAIDPFYGAPSVIFVSHRKQIYNPALSFQTPRALLIQCIWPPQVLALAACLCGVLLRQCAKFLISIIRWF